MMDTRIHPETGQRLHRDVRPITVTYASQSRTVDVPGWYPDGEGDAIHSGEDLAVIDEATRLMRAAYAADLRRLRKALKLSQEQAGRVFGGGPRAFQKYEAGLMPPSDAAVGLIELVRRDPSMIAVLTSLPGRNIADEACRRGDPNAGKRAAA